MLGLDTIDHVDPFHDSISVRSALVVLVVMLEPTDMHADGPLHDTPARKSFGEGLGLATIDHAVPFHDSISV
jgi:hypothetical protein